MLFPYQYLPHQLDTMQSYVKFIFEEVWCNATDGQNYDIDVLFSNYPDLRDMITELHTQELAGANSFLTSLQALFESFKTLAEDQKQQFRDWFVLNNNIQHLCEQGDQCQPATYQHIQAQYPDDQFPGLVAELKYFYKNLYSSNFLTLASVKSRVGDIGEHNDEFTELNDRDVCPFCGLSGMLNRYHSKREAYDHYFPKDKYPFNSINFFNLVPACPHCNSSYKLAQDPHYNSKDPLQAPRKVFYPFANEVPGIELNIDINQPDWEKICPSDINITIGPVGLESELATWNDLYGINERYIAECCSKNSGKTWLTEVFSTLR